jgi:hypothetical protein
MRQRVPVEIDDLMWTIAERGETKAVEEFEARYPEHKYELARRIAMLRGLKVEGSRAHPTKHPPAFRPREVRRTPPPRRMMLAVGALCLAAVAAASYTVVSFMQPAPPRSVERQPKLPPVIETQEPPTPALKDLPPVVQETPPPDPVTTTPPADPPHLRPQDLRVERAPLMSALELIAQQGGIRLTIGPGMPNPDVKLEYTGTSTLQMLQDLGHRYGFTPFDQGDGSVLIIPATDPGAPVAGNGMEREDRQLPLKERHEDTSEP